MQIRDIIVLHCAQISCYNYFHAYLCKNYEFGDSFEISFSIFGLEHFSGLNLWILLSVNIWTCSESINHCYNWKWYVITRAIAHWVKVCVPDQVKHIEPLLLEIINIRITWESCVVNLSVNECYELDWWYSQVFECLFLQIDII